MVEGDAEHSVPHGTVPFLNIPYLFHASEILNVLDDISPDQFFESAAAIPEVVSLYMLFEAADLLHPWGQFEEGMFEKIALLRRKMGWEKVNSRFSESLDSLARNGDDLMKRLQTFSEITSDAL